MALAPRTPTAKTRELISRQPYLAAGSGQASSPLSGNHKGVSDPAPNVETSPRRRTRRQGCAALLIAGFALALLLIGAAASYWRYVNYVPPYTPQFQAMPEPNGLDEALAALQDLPSTEKVAPDGLLLEPLEKIRPIVLQARPALDRVRATFRMQWKLAPAANSEEIDYAALGSFRPCQAFFAAEMRLAQSDGHPDLALRRALDGIELGVLVSKGGEVIGWLSSAAIFTIAFGQIDGLSMDSTSDGTHSELVRARRLRRTFPKLSDVLEAQHVISVGDATELFRRWSAATPVAQYQNLAGYMPETSPMTLIHALLTPRRQVLAQTDQYWQEFMEQARRPVSSRDRVVRPDDLWAQYLLMDADYWLRGTLERFETCLALLEVRLAVRMHFLETGAYPAALTDISKEWLPEIPLDIWEQPLHYRLAKGKPVVYSLGPDGVDDEGRAFDPNRLDRDTLGDMVYGQLGKLREAE